LSHAGRLNAERNLQLRFVLCFADPVLVRVQSRALSSKFGPNYGSVLAADKAIFSWSLTPEVRRSSNKRDCQTQGFDGD